MRTGGEGRCTRRFSAFPAAIREKVLEAASLSVSEDVVIASYVNDGNWVLLSTENLITKRDGAIVRVGWPEIANATIDSDEVRVALGLSDLGKLQLGRLRLTRTDGGQLTLELEPGPSFVAFWNVLKTVAILGSSSPRKS